MNIAGLSPLATRIDDRCLLFLNNINLKKIRVRGGGQAMMTSFFVQAGGGGGGGVES